VWQPNRTQWRVIWPVAIALVLLWPPVDGPSLAVTALRWIADPADSLPRLPEDLPMALGDNGDAVAAHDEQAAEYYRLADSSAWIRTRLRLKAIADPVTPPIMRQILGATVILSALAIWRLGERNP
jgi:hypothetical protein